MTWLSPHKHEWTEWREYTTFPEIVEETWIGFGKRSSPPRKIRDCKTCPISQWKWDEEDKIEVYDAGRS